MRTRFLCCAFEITICVLVAAKCSVYAPSSSFMHLGASFARRDGVFVSQLIKKRRYRGCLGEGARERGGGLTESLNSVIAGQ